MPFFVAVPLPTATKETIMDNDVIDLSHMSKEEVREHLRRLSDLASCPCLNCIRICDPTVYASCEAYQIWHDERISYGKNRPRRDD